MNFLADAETAEWQDDPVTSAAEYEKAIVTGEAPPEIRIRYAVLLFQCCDPGYAAAKKLTEAFISYALPRAMDLLGDASSASSLQLEAEFWLDYVRFVCLGGELDEGRWRRALDESGFLLPIIYFGTAGHHAEAKRLRDHVALRRNALERYVFSVVDASLGRRN